MQQNYRLYVERVKEVMKTMKFSVYSHILTIILNGTYLLLKFREVKPKKRGEVKPMVLHNLPTSPNLDRVNALPLITPLLMNIYFAKRLILYAKKVKPNV